MKAITCLLFAVLLCSCGTMVDYDYNSQTDFSKLKSYDYFTDMETGLTGLDTKRIMRAIDGKMDSLGINKSDTPDFYIDIQSVNIQNRNNSAVGIGVGGTGRRVGGGISVGIPVGSTQNTREITIDFVDKDRKTLLWKAVSTGNYKKNATPEQRDNYFDALVEKVFIKFPPNTKK